MRTLVLSYSLFLTGLFLSTFLSAENSRNIILEVTIPQIESSQYRRPFVAIWLEEEKNWKENQTLSVWFDDAQWLKDLRRWWRKVGRYQHNLDAVSGATRPAGNYKIEKPITLKDNTDYTLLIEAVREHGDRTLIKQRVSVDSFENPFSIAAGDEIGPIHIHPKDAL